MAEKTLIRDYMGISKSLEDYREYFIKLWPDSKPLAKLFKTDSRGYLYDTGTNKIFECDNIEYDILNYLLKYDIEEALYSINLKYPENVVLKAINDIGSLINNKNILKTARSFKFLHLNLGELEKAVNENLTMILLEVTEKCNLRCAYCIYDSHYKEKRNHGIRDMAMATAKKGIEHLARSSNNNKTKVGITFYGGEPLICFPTIKACVEYARNVIKNKEILFSITTNATLMTSEMAKYFVKEGFSIRVSIDGPKEIHDEYRRDINGHGSFERTIKGLENLYEAYGEEKGKIGLSMVFAPPFSNEKIDQITELWQKYPWISKEIGVVISYAEGFYPSVMNNEKKHDRKFTLFDWAARKYLDKYQDGMPSHTVAANIVEREMVKYVQRQVYSGPLEKYHLNGCCIPASRKQFVTVEGDIILCERIGMAPAIGNVDTGVDINKLYNLYIKEYSEACYPSCSNCWALQLCSACYLHAFSGNRINIPKKDQNCISLRELIERSLRLYCRLLEIRKDGLDYLLEWIIE